MWHHLEHKFQEWLSNSVCQPRGKSGFGPQQPLGWSCVHCMIVVWDVWWLITEPTVKGWMASYLATTACQPNWTTSDKGDLRAINLRWWWWTVASTKIRLQIFLAWCMGSMGWKDWDHLFTEWRCGKINHNLSCFLKHWILKYFTQLLRNFMFCNSIIIYIPFWKSEYNIFNTTAGIWINWIIFCY